MSFSYYKNLPKNWSLTTLGKISKVITKGTTPRGGNVSYTSSGIGFLRAENISGYDKLNLDNLKYVDNQTHTDFLKRSILESEDILALHFVNGKFASVLQRLADYLKYDQEGFAELLAEKTNKDMLNEQKNAKTQIDQSLARINKIDVLYERLYEDNVSGKVTDSFYMELSHKYENEKEELKKKIFNLKIQLDELNKKVFHKEMFLSAIEKFMEMKTITAPLIRELIDHIEVHETEGEGKYKTQRIVIFYRFVGYIEIPEMALNQEITKDTRQGVAVSYIPKAITA